MFPTSTQNKQNWLNFFCLACPFVASSCKLNFTHTVAHISTLTHTHTDRLTDFLANMHTH